jgi:hypothetical protein
MRARTLAVRVGVRGTGLARARGMTRSTVIVGGVLLDCHQLYRHGAPPPAPPLEELP